MASAQKQSANVDLFDAYFRRADLDPDGRISGNEAVAFFQGSGLPKLVLAQMHHMIRDMARGIVRLESKEPGERSRLWHHKDSFAVLAEKNGTQTIEGLALNVQNHPEYSSSRNSNQVVFETDAFSMMHKLRLLQLTYVELNGSYEEFPTSLRWLCWHKFLKGSIPSDFSLKNLVVLEMCYSSMRQVWKGTKQPILGPGAWHMATPAGGRPLKPVAPSHAEEKQQANQQKPRVPELEKHLVNQLST
ncbi:unnamed protein product [Malus baccata var. baccata]